MKLTGNTIGGWALAFLLAIAVFVIVGFAMYIAALADEAQAGSRFKQGPLWHMIKSPNTEKCYEYVMIYQYSSWTAGMSETDC